MSLLAPPPSAPLLERGDRGDRFLGAASGFRGLTTTATFGPRRDMCSGGTRGGSPCGEGGGDASISGFTGQLFLESSFSLNLSFSPSVGGRETRDTSSRGGGSGSLEDCDDEDFPMPESVSDDGLPGSLPPVLPSERLRSEWPPFSEDSEVSRSRTAGSSSSSSEGMGSRWPVKGLMR